MSTRSLTHVYNEQGKQIINLYRQMDGYPEGHGTELAQFLAEFTKENPTKFANGMSDLAAQLVAHFKEAPYNFYLEPVSYKDLGQEWEYDVRWNKDSDVIMSVYRSDYQEDGKPYKRTKMWAGHPEDFLPEKLQAVWKVWVVP